MPVDDKGKLVDAGHPLNPWPGDAPVPITKADIRRAIVGWDRMVPDAAGLLKAAITKADREQAPGEGGTPA